MAYDLDSAAWTELTETSGMFYNKSGGNDVILANTAATPTNEDDVMKLRAGERRYIEVTENKIFAKTLGGEAILAITGFLSSSGVLREQIQNCLRLGYVFAGNLEGVTVITDTETVYYATDGDNFSYYKLLVETSVPYLHDGTSLIDSEYFEEITAESMKINVFSSGTLDLELDIPGSFVPVFSVTDPSKFNEVRVYYSNVSGIANVPVTTSLSYTEWVLLYNGASLIGYLKVVDGEVLIQPVSTVVVRKVIFK